MRTTVQKTNAVQKTNVALSGKENRTLAEESRDVELRAPGSLRIGNRAGGGSPQDSGDAPKGKPTPGFSHVIPDFSRIPIHPVSAPHLQLRTMISSPGDFHEREAEQVADRVMRMPEPMLARKCECGGSCPKCRGEEDVEASGGFLQRRSEGDASAAETETPSIVNDVLRSPGRPLDSSTRSFFEPRFGADFSGVRIHTGGPAAESARAVRAKAYTFGHNIVFGRGEYNPGSSAGKHLLAHELTHVRQQSGLRQARIDRFAECGPAANCPAREPGEESAAQTDPMSIHNIGDPPGILVANFAVGSARIKSDLTPNPDFARVQSEMRRNPGFRWEILGFSDCEGGEVTNTSLRTDRANALLRALPSDLRSQITGTRGAPINDCMQGNATVLGRRLNRSAFLRQTVSEVTFADEEVAPPAGPHLYGVTSPASEYFVRATPHGDIIGQLVLREMRVQVIDDWGTNIDDLWLQVRFRPDDMAAIQAAYNRRLAARLAELQPRQARLQQSIARMESGPVNFNVAALIAHSRRELAPIDNEIRQIQGQQGRAPYTGLTAWVGASALGVVAMHYDTFLDLVDAFDRARANQPLRDRLTRLRQFGEDASLEGDTVIGRGGNFPNRQTQSSRRNTSDWQLLFEAKQIRMPDGTFIDVHHFILGLDALALPRSDQSSSRVLTRAWGIARVDVGESWSAVTWSGDIGGAVGDYVLHKSGSWEAANTRDDNQQRRQFYMDTRAPEMDLLADIDSWGAFTAIPRTSVAPTNFTSLRQIIEATYGPAGQTAGEYRTQITPRRRQGVENFLCNYGFTSPTGLVSQTAARARVLEQVRIFATGWYDARASSTGVNTVFGRTDETDARILTASGQMTDMFLNWLQSLASRVGLTALPCNTPLSSPLRRPG